MVLTARADIVQGIGEGSGETTSCRAPERNRWGKPTARRVPEILNPEENAKKKKEFSETKRSFIRSLSG